MKNIIIFTLLISSLNLKAQVYYSDLPTEKYPKSVSKDKRYYKPHRKVIGPAFAYAELYFNHASQRNQLNSLNNVEKPYRGTALRFGVKRAFNMSRYEYNKYQGVLGKRNSFYGQFGFGWMFSSGFMTHTANVTEVKSKDELEYVVGDFFYHGPEINVGLVYNHENLFALVSNFSFVPIAFAKERSPKRMFESDLTKRIAMRFDFGVRFRNLSVKIITQALHFNATQEKEEVVYGFNNSVSTSSEIIEDRFAVLNVGIGLTYNYNFK